MNNIIGTNVEYLITKIDIHQESKNALNKILMTKIKRNSIAYNEIRNYISNLELIILQYEQEYKAVTNNTEQFSTVKLKTSVLQKLIEFKKDFDYPTISSFIEDIIDHYKKDFCTIDCMEVFPSNLDLNLELALNKYDCHVCTVKDKSKPIVYKLDDLIFHDNCKYIDLRKMNITYVEYKYFFISKKFTLEEIENIQDIWSIYFDS